MLPVITRRCRIDGMSGHGVYAVSVHPTVSGDSELALKEIPITAIVSGQHTRPASANPC